jgi:hypothetical protein
MSARVRLTARGAVESSRLLDARRLMCFRIVQCRFDVCPKLVTFGVADLGRVGGVPGELAAMAPPWRHPACTARRRTVCDGDAAKLRSPRVTTLAQHGSAASHPPAHVGGGWRRNDRQARGHAALGGHQQSPTGAVPAADVEPSGGQSVMAATQTPTSAGEPRSVPWLRNAYELCSPSLDAGMMSEAITNPLREAKPPSH